MKTPAFGLGGAELPALLARAEDTVDGGDEDECDHRGEGEAPCHRHTQRAPHLTALPTAQCQRQHADNGGEGGHENRAQTAAGGCFGSFQHAHTAFAHEVGVVDEHDTVVHHDTDEDEDAYHRHDVQCGSGGPEAQHHAHKSERYAEHYHERVHEVLELRRHHHVNEQQDEHEQGHQVFHHVLLVLVVTCQLRGDVVRNIDRLHDFPHTLHALAHGHALGGNAGHGDVALAVLALDGGRHLAFHHGSQFLDSDGTAHRGGEHHVFDVGHAAAELLGIADSDVVFVAFLAEVRHHAAAHCRAESGCCSGGVETVHGQLLTVEIDLVYITLFIISSQQA